MTSDRRSAANSAEELTGFVNVQSRSVSLRVPVIPAPHAALFAPPQGPSRPAPPCLVLRAGWAAVPWPRGPALRRFVAAGFVPGGLAPERRCDWDLGG